MHPAFLAFESEGMQVVNFEVGYKKASTTIKNENNPNKVQIKPNVYSWRDINEANTK